MVKVFVGNLAFKTTEADLAREFAAAGKVSGANIITRGPRSLGYGFVEFDSLDDANNAVKLLNKKEIDGRPVNVEVAKPRPEGEEAAAAAGQNNEGGDAAGRGRGGRRGGRGRGARGGRGGRGGQRGGARPANNNNNSSSNNEGQQQQEGASEEVEDTARPRGGRRGRGGRGRGARGAARGGRGGQRNVQNKDQPDTRVESKTTLFVANLPFSLDDESFGKVFTDDGLKFKSAHVVQKRNGRSKGFGFAEFDTEEDQKKALNALNNKKIQDRELIVKIALTEDAAKQAGEQQQ